MGFRLFCGILLIILEMPFYFKIRREFDIIRQTAIAIIMIVIIPAIVFGIYLLGLQISHIFSIS